MRRLRDPRLWVGLTWLGLLLSLLVTLPQSNWSTSVTAALPDADQAWQQALMRDGQSTRQVTLVLQGEDRSALESSARDLHRVAEERIEWQSPATMGSELQQTYRRYAGQLASPRDWQALQDGRIDALLERAQQRLYSPVGLGGVALQQDPLLLTPAFIESGASGFGDLTAREQWLEGKHDGDPFLLLHGKLRFNAFDQDAALSFDTSLNAAVDRLTEAHPGLQIERSGAVFHAVAAAQQARFEISTYGTLSLLAIVVLLSLMFRSARPFILTAVTLTLAAASGLAALLLVFPTPHILAMVFATTLIGVAVDYSFHGMLGVQRGAAGFKAMLPNLRLGLLTSLVGYLVLLVLPFPLLQQVAVFVGTGLLAAYLAVHLIFPYLLRPGQLRSTQRVEQGVDTVVQSYQRIGRKPAMVLLYLAAAVLVLTLGLLATADDEVSNFHQSPAHLMQQENMVRKLSAQMWSPAVLVVAGNSTQQRLQHEESLHQDLQQLQQAGALQAWQALSRRVPSVARQQAVQQRRHALADDPAFADYLATLELTLSEPSTEFMTPAQVPGTEQHRLDTGTGRYSLILLQLSDGASSAVADVAQAHEFVEFYNPLQSANETVAELRGQLGSWIVLALVLAWLLLCVKRGAIVSTHIAAYLVTAISCSLLLAQLVQGSLNLFNLVAGLLVMALALDYAVFITSRVERHDVVKAVYLSALTTCLAFGLLSFSFTPVIAAFGISVFGGVAAALAATPLLAGLRRLKEK